MPTNDFLPFSTSDVNTVAQATYAANTSMLTNGNVPGTNADALYANKAWRQGTLIASVVAQYINAKTGQNTVDNGTTATLLTQLAQAIALSAFVEDTSGIVNVMTGTILPAPVLEDGMLFTLKPAQTNTSTVTLDLNGLGVYPIITVHGALTGGELTAGNFFSLVWQASSSSFVLLDYQTTAPTLSTSDNSNNIATTAFVKGQNYIGAASPSFTGTPTAPTPGSGDNSTNIATTAFVANNFVNQTGGVLTATPTTGDNSLKVATTAFVANNAVSLTTPVLLASPSAGDNSLKVATTAFIQTPRTFVTKLVRGYYSYYAQTNDNKIYSWGNNASMYQLGQGSTNANELSSVIEFPTYLYTGGYTILDFTVQYGSAYVLWSNGDLYVWGDNSSGQLGLGTTTNQASPVLSTTGVTNLYYAKNGYDSDWNAGAQQLAMFIKKSTGLFYAAGYNANGNMGLGNTTNPISNWTPLVLPSGKTVANIWVSSSVTPVTFLQATDNTLWACGTNNAGQIGDGTTTQRTSWVQITYFGTSYVFADIQSNGYYYPGGYNYNSTTFLTSAGLMFTCGNSVYGQLGTGSTTYNYTPSQITFTGGKTVAKVIKPSFSVWVLFTDNTYARWGLNGNGSLGNGTLTQQNTPVYSTSGDPGGQYAANIFATTASGAYTYINQTFVLKSTGLYFCGYNDAGCSGLGNNTINGNITALTAINLNNTSSSVLDVKVTGSYNGATSTAIAFSGSPEIVVAGYNGSYACGDVTGGSKFSFRSTKALPIYK